MVKEQINETHRHDVLCGRGGKTNQHIGNRNYLRLVELSCTFYSSVPKYRKLLVSKSIVGAIRSQNPPGRFLTRNSDTGKWHDIGDERATQKTSQALREAAAASKVQKYKSLKNIHKRQKNRRISASSALSSRSHQKVETSANPSVINELDYCTPELLSSSPEKVQNHRAISNSKFIFDEANTSTLPSIITPVASRPKRKRSSESELFEQQETNIKKSSLEHELFTKEIFEDLVDNSTKRNKENNLLTPFTNHDDIVQELLQEEMLTDSDVEDFLIESSRPAFFIDQGIDTNNFEKEMKTILSGNDSSLPGTSWKEDLETYMQDPEDDIQQLLSSIGSDDDFLKPFPHDISEILTLLNH